MGKIAPPGTNGSGRILWLSVLMLASLALLAGVRKRSAYVLALCLTMLLLWSACGGGGGGGGAVVHAPGTPAGSYTLNVNATVTSTATSTVLTHTIPLTMTVN